VTRLARFGLALAALLMALPFTTSGAWGRPLVTPPTQPLSFSENPIAFGNVVDGTTSRVTITATNAEPTSSVTLGTLYYTSSDTFTMNDNCSGKTLLPGGTCTFDVIVATTAPGSGTGAVQVLITIQGSTTPVTEQDPITWTGVAATCDTKISPTALPAGSVGQSYSAALTTTGGTVPYIYSLGGGSLPPGLTLNATSGQLFGTPTQAGDYSVVVKSVDATNCTATQSYAIVVNSGCPSPVGTTTSGSISSAFAHSASCPLPTCNCVKLTAALGHFKVSDGGTRIDFRLSWKLRCTAGSGHCKGQIVIQGPSGFQFSGLGAGHKRTATVSCSGSCSLTNQGHVGLTWMPAPVDRAGKTVHVKLLLKCFKGVITPAGQGGLVATVSTETFQIAFNSSGKVVSVHGP
jgi:hypothetical protein